MQTNLAALIKDTAEGREADAILRACVHCGFCLATCPTYQLLGDERDSPRGRIYLIKEMLEGAPVTASTRTHLDRCLTCRACETTCPSGVQYGKLVDIGRGIIEARVPRDTASRLTRLALRKLVASRRLFAPLYRMGRLLRPLLPKALKSKIMVPRPAGAWPFPEQRHARKMLVLGGCVQPAMAPGINTAAARVLDKLGISLVRPKHDGCCGAIAQHLSAHEEALAHARRNIDAWWPHIEDGAEALIVTASGCGTMIEDYAALLRHDEQYAHKAARVSQLTRDVSQVVAEERPALERQLAQTAGTRTPMQVAFHSPCSLQHGLKIRGVVEPLLTAAGYQLTYVPDGHLCCGSAGTYSILQPELSLQLLANKVRALESGAPQIIATANIGCLAHIESGASTPVAHWIELLADRL